MVMEGWMCGKLMRRMLVEVFVPSFGGYKCAVCIYGNMYTPSIFQTPRERFSHHSLDTNVPGALREVAICTTKIF